MRILPLNYSLPVFGKRRVNVSTPEDTKDKRIAESMAVIIPAIVIGMGYAVIDKNDYGSQIAVNESKITEINNFDALNLFDKINVENVKINKVSDNEFNFTADANLIDKISGSLIKSKNNPDFMYGEFTKNGIIDKNYKFALTIESSDEVHNDAYKMNLTLHGKNDKVKKYLIEKNNGDDDIYLNGKRLPNSEERSVKNLAGILSLVILLGAYNMVRE